MSNYASFASDQCELRVPTTRRLFIFWQLLRTSAWRSDVDYRAVLRHRDPDASVLNADRCRSVADNRSWRRSPVGVDHSWWRRTHESSNFSLTGPIFFLAADVTSRAMHSSTNCDYFVRRTTLRLDDRAFSVAPSLESAAIRTEDDDVHVLDRNFQLDASKLFN